MEGRQHAAQGVGPRVPLEANAGVGKLQHHPELVERKGIAPTLMTRVLRPTLLAPNLVEAIQERWQGLEVTPARSMRAIVEPDVI